MTMTTRPPAEPVSDEWRRWITENLLLRVADDDILAVLGAHGMAAARARAAIGSVRADPCFHAAERIAQRLRKAESVLHVMHELSALDPMRSQVDRVRALTREQFLSRYYAANRPVLLDDLVDDWPALRSWSPKYLRDTIPDARVEVMADRESDAEYEVNSELHRRTMSMVDYVDTVVSGGAGNDIYLVANNYFFDNPAVAALTGDFSVPGPFLDPAKATGSIFLWFGPAGTVTPLHHDVLNVLFVQVFGTKRITLVPALEVYRVYNSVSVYSDVDAAAPDLERFPLFAGATRLDVIVEPGQALFIPVGWWHRVEALSTSISMSFTNFVFPNDYVWQHPERLG
jgi:ribosomal protein L16 Arg81 hydroxylase